MAKKSGRKKAAKQALRLFKVYQQSDGGLVVMRAEDEPEMEMDPVWEGEAVDERDAVAEARHAEKWLRKAHTAVPEHDPNQPMRLRDSVQEATNERLGITNTRSKKRGGSTKRTKTGVKKKVVAKRMAKKKFARR